ncbi:hypothetical protein NUW54_g6946 [Trametes sanguinea]|uniref:Uncharacterized protein n=1 Tax=Trametes sanguinea TaxID=158606 RepID=A0ACC1PSV9_9APHY|nr:hypothetical protein NUW54_g6946 [Trametes sanguinea]
MPVALCVSKRRSGVFSVRRRVRTQLAKLEDVTDVVVRIQAAVRTYLARKRLLGLIRGLRTATPALIKLQAVARAKLARQQHEEMQRALSEVKVVKAVGSFQARARAALARSRHQEQVKKLEFVEPDVVGFQATARGYLARLEWYAWRDYIRSSHPQATYLQALLRGVLQRRKFREKMAYYRSNLDKIVQIQSLFRAKETREQYRQLTLGTNVTVGTIKNFVHLLDDSEADFQEEIKVERLRQEVVKRIRENQALEHDVSELDVKIALVVPYIEQEFAKLESKNKLKVEMLGGGMPWMADYKHWNYEAARRATEVVYKRSPDLTREGGSIPVTLTFAESLGVNVLLLPMGRGDDGAHSTNEKLDRLNFIEGSKLLGTYLYELAAIQAP